jgi:hypothetical protein
MHFEPSPEVAEIMRRHELQVQRDALIERIEQERQASRERRAQREAELDRAWRQRCQQRGMPPYPRPRFTWSREDGVETLAILGCDDPRIVWGCASTATITSHKTSRDPAGARIQFPIPLKAGHKVGSIGQVVHVRKSPKSLFIRAVLDDNAAADHAWELIRTGTLKALSVGVERDTSECIAEVDGVTYFRRWSLSEVSVCRSGANPDAWCRIYRP